MLKAIKVSLALATLLGSLASFAQMPITARPELVLKELVQGMPGVEPVTRMPSYGV